MQQSRYTLDHEGVKGHDLGGVRSDDSNDQKRMRNKRIWIISWKETEENH